MTATADHAAAALTLVLDALRGVTVTSIKWSADGVHVTVPDPDVRRSVVRRLGLGRPSLGRSNHGYGAGTAHASHIGTWADMAIRVTGPADVEDAWGAA